MTKGLEVTNGRGRGAEASAGKNPRQTSCTVSRAPLFVPGKERMVEIKIFHV